MSNFVIKEIENKFNEYISIYKNESIILSEDGKTLLENSIYLSIFTAFENFLKLTIESFIIEKKDNLLAENIKSDISEEIIFGNKGTTIKNRSNFENISILINNPLKEGKLRNAYKFKFLHDDAIEKYYNKIFHDILGISYYFNKLTLENKNSSIPNLETIETIHANKFLSDFTKNIRNSIAHQNHIFKTKISDYSIPETCDFFLQIIRDISIKFFQHNNAEIRYSEKYNALDI